MSRRNASRSRSRSRGRQSMPFLSVESRSTDDKFRAIEEAMKRIDHLDNQMNKLIEGISNGKRDLESVQEKCSAALDTIKSGQMLFDAAKLEKGYVMLEQAEDQEEEIFKHMNKTRRQLATDEKEWEDNWRNIRRWRDEIMCRAIADVDGIQNNVNKRYDSRRNFCQSGLSKEERKEWQDYERECKKMRSKERDSRRRVEETTDGSLEHALTEHSTMLEKHQRWRLRQQDVFKQAKKIEQKMDKNVSRKDILHLVRATANVEARKKEYHRKQYLIRDAECPVCIEVKEDSTVFWPCLHHVCGQHRSGCTQHFRVGADCPTCRTKIEKERFVDGKPFQVSFKIGNKTFACPINWNAGDVDADLNIGREDDAAPDDCIILSSSSSPERPAGRDQIPNRVSASSSAIRCPELI